MNRRLFLASLTGLVVDPERLLWTPGKKLISIPPPTKYVYFLGPAYVEWEYSAPKGCMVKLSKRSWMKALPIGNGQYSIIT